MLKTIFFHNITMKMVKGLSVCRAPQEQWRKPNKSFARLIGQKSVMVEPFRAFKGGLVLALEISVTFIYVKLVQTIQLMKNIPWILK